MYKLIVQPPAAKQLRKLPRAKQEKIAEVLNLLKQDPFLGKKLRGSHTGKYALRVWPYRIIYMVKKQKVTVYGLAIGHRQGIH